MKLIANSQRTHIENFTIELPQSSFKMDTIRVRYDSLGAFQHFADQVHFSFQTLPSQLTLKDISPFVPALAHFKDPITIDMNVQGTVNQLECSNLEITAFNRKFRLKGDASLQDLSHPGDAYIYGTLSDLSIHTQGMDHLVRNLVSHYTGTPPVLKRLGDINFRGEISGYFNDLVTYGLLRTSLGNVQTDLKLSSNKEKGLFSYSGSVKTHNYKLGTLVANSKLGEITFNLDVHGRHAAHQLPSIELKGLVSSIDYSQYKYENITLDGIYKSGGFNGKVALDDPNGSVLLNGNFNVATQTPTFNFLAVIDKVRPHDLNLTDKYADSDLSLKLKADFTGGSIDEMKGEINIDSLQFQSPDKSYFMKNMNIQADSDLSLKLKADFTGGSIDEMKGEINIDSLQFQSPDKSYFMKNMNIQAHKEDGENQLKLRSEFLTADIKGQFQYHTLPASVMNILRKYVDSSSTTPCLRA